MSEDAHKTNVYDEHVELMNKHADDKHQAKHDRPIILEKLIEKGREVSDLRLIYEMLDFHPSYETPHLKEIVEDKMEENRKDIHELEKQARKIEEGLK